MQCRLSVTRHGLPVRKPVPATEWPDVIIAADDGVRLWVDDRLLIDQWQHPQVATFQADVTLSQGYHRVRLVTSDHAPSSEGYPLI